MLARARTDTADKGNHPRVCAESAESLRLERAIGKKSGKDVLFSFPMNLFMEGWGCFDGVWVSPLMGWCVFDGKELHSGKLTFSLVCGGEVRKGEGEGRRGRRGRRKEKPRKEKAEGGGKVRRSRPWKREKSIEGRWGETDRGDGGGWGRGYVKKLREGKRGREKR